MRRSTVVVLVLVLPPPPRPCTYSPRSTKSDLGTHLRATLCVDGSFEEVPPETSPRSASRPLCGKAQESSILARRSRPRGWCQNGALGEVAPSAQRLAAVGPVSPKPPLRIRFGNAQQTRRSWRQVAIQSVASSFAVCFGIERRRRPRRGLPTGRWRGAS